jgi:hypothetical protein
MTVRRRWDIDEVGHGVASAREMAPEARRLVDVMESPDWVAEAPEHHLLPHIERACSAPGAPLRLDGWSVQDGGVLELQVTYVAGDPSPSTIRLAALAVLAEIAEARTFTIERGPVFEMVTGVLDDDGEFAAHGHVVRLVVGEA